MKFKELPKKKQVEIIEGIAQAIADKVKDKFANLLHYEKGTKQYEEFSKGWKKGEGPLRTMLASMVWLKSRFGMFDVDDKEYIAELEDKVANEYMKKALKNKKMKKVLSQDEKQVQKVVKKEERRVRRIDKIWKRHHP